MDAPRGFLQYTVMKVMIEKNGLTSQEIRRIAKETKHGKGSFDPKDDRGYYSQPFIGMMPERGTFMRTAAGEGWVTRLCNSVGGKYRLTSEGLEKFEELKSKFGSISFERAVRVAEFKRKYGKQLDSFDKRNKEKSLRVACSNGMVSVEGNGIVAEFEDLADPITPVPFRGLELDDEVIYYRKKTGESGEGYISSITTYSEKVVNQSCFSIATGEGFIKGIGYVDSQDIFLESTGDEIQIISKVLK